MLSTISAGVSACGTGIRFSGTFLLRYLMTLGNSDGGGRRARMSSRATLGGGSGLTISGTWKLTEI